MASAKILVFAGSIRSGAFSGKLAAVAAKELAVQDAEVSLISLADYPLPIYDADLESGTAGERFVGGRTGATYDDVGSAVAGQVLNRRPERAVQCRVPRRPIRSRRVSKNAYVARSSVRSARLSVRFHWTVAAVQLRGGGRRIRAARRALVSAAADDLEEIYEPQQIVLSDLINRVLDKGVVIAGDLGLSVAERIAGGL